MSLVITTDVECDRTGCQTWVHGITSHTKSDGTTARQAARTQGWVRRRFGDQLFDLCPAHADCLLSEVIR